jgi:hypothetical protein
MDNNTTTTGSSDSSGNSNGPDFVSIIALVVSLIALIGTVAQVLQQYYASAAGYSNCGESVMGEWHKSKKRIFRPTELRFEVQFESPVLFVCSANNQRGPIKKQAIYFVQGTDQSHRETKTLLPSEDAAARVARESNVHTADNERATWVTLLSELQNMERTSHDWQMDEYAKAGPAKKKQAEFKDRTLAVALQSKPRSWDTMPTGVQKPYATTTMCHLVEMVAMLGIHWREFDRSRDRYRAEGNGYILTGGKVADLGIVFTFQLAGERRFRDTRVIPVQEVKELAFGVVSTFLLTEKTDPGMLKLLDQLDSSREIHRLQLGSMSEIAESLVLIGCNTNTTNFFKSERKQGHLFPGMDALFTTAPSAACLVSLVGRTN